MSRYVFWFKDNDECVFLEADKLCEDTEYLKAYQRGELVGIFDLSIIEGAYKMDEKKG